MKRLSGMCLVAGAVALMTTLAGCGGGGGGSSVADSVPANARMAAVGNSGDLRIYDMGSGGTLSFVQAYNVGFDVVSMARDQASNTFYFGCGDTDGIEFVRFNAEGMVIGQGTAETANSNVILRKHPTKPVLYALDSVEDKVYFYGIAANGGLTPLDPPTLDVGDTPRDLVLSPDGESVYIVFESFQQVLNGSVTESGHFVEGGAVVTPNVPQKLVMSQDGSKLFSVGVGSSIYQFTICENGTTVASNPAFYNFGMANFRADVSSRGLLAVYREMDEGITILASSGSGILSSVGSYPTNAVTNVFGTPWANTFLFARQSGTAGEMVIGTDGGEFTKVQDVVLPSGTVDAEFYIAP